MEKKIAILGGDLRIALLAELLANENWQVQTYGLEQYEAKEPMEKVAELAEFCQRTNLTLVPCHLAKMVGKLVHHLQKKRF